MKRHLLTSATVLACLAPAISQAQDRPDLLDEIVVTAQKRSENIQDVPISISAFSGDDLNALGITESEQLGQFIPGLELSTSSGEGSQLIIFLRGAGLNDFNTNNAGPIGIYSDEVYISSPALTAFQFFDTERLEILKGPQGTLYGRNTTGGAVKFISNKPTDEFEFQARGSYSRFDTTDVEAAISGPITDNIRARFAINKVDSDGFLENTIDPSNITDENSVDTLSWRGTIDVDVTENFSLRGNVHGANVNSEGAKFVFIGLGPDGTGPLGTPSQTDPFSGQYNRDDDIDLDSIGGYIEAKLDIGDIQITSISAYDELDRLLPEETDANALDILFINYDVKSETFSQELRATGSYGDSSWLIGGFYLTEDLEQDQSIDLFGSLRPLFAPLGVNIPGVTSPDPTPVFFARANNFQTIETFAIFGQTDVAVTDKLTLTLGGRYTDEDRTFDARGTIEEESLADIVGNPLVVYEGTDLETSDGEFSWRFGLDYKLDDDTLLYGSIARGFKSGGFNGGFLSLDPVEAITQLEPFDPEFLTAYEVGFKTDLLDNKLRLNGALFYNDFSDLQVFTQINTGGLPLLVLDNATSAEVLGAEFDATFYPHPNLLLNLTGAFMDSRIGSLSVNGVDLTGNTIPNTPDASVSGLARYDHDLGDYGSVYLQGSFAYRDDVFFSTENLDFTGQEAYTLANLRLGYTAESQNWGIAVFGNNIGDTTYFTNVSNNSDFGFASATLGTPRSYGVELSVNF